jgi:hypothetical protein
MIMLSLGGTAAVQWTSDPPAAGVELDDGLAAAEAALVGEPDAELVGVALGVA